MTREHIFLCIALHIPFVIVVTKIDVVSDKANVLKDTNDIINKLLKLPRIRRLSCKIVDDADVVMCAKQIHGENIVPIFYVSNLTGQGLDKLRMFLNLLPGTIISDEKQTTAEVEYRIDNVWSVPGVGTVVGGMLLSGRITTGSKLYLGPNNGAYEEVRIRSIYSKKMPVQIATSGSYVCLGLIKILKSSIRNGNVIVSTKEQQLSVRTFTVEMKVLCCHSTTVRRGYEPIVHTSSIRQSATIVSVKNKKCAMSGDDDDVLRTGDTATVTFRFCFQPEYLMVGTHVLFCEGMTKLFGIVQELE